MVFHVLNHGDARAGIFAKDEDDAAFERVMKETLEKKSMRILGYLMMPDAFSLRDPVRGGARSEAGRFGAGAAKLMQFLDESHFSVRLSEEERWRIIVWLDAHSGFRGDHSDYEGN